MKLFYYPKYKSQLFIHTTYTYKLFIAVYLPIGGVMNVMHNTVIKHTTMKVHNQV